MEGERAGRETKATEVAFIHSTFAIIIKKQELDSGSTFYTDEQELFG